MIAPQELRIGNYLQYKEGKDVAIVAFVSNKHFDCHTRSGFFTPNGEYEPIELTEDWLLRMGFEKVKSYYEEAETFDFYYGNIYFDMANQSTKINGHYCLSCVPDSVHQLQNLFHSLTGEELKLTN